MTSEPNIVVVTVDSLRADYCSFMGHERETTPALDALAEGGIVFEHAIAPGPSTPESMPAVFTGAYPVDEADRSDIATLQASIQTHMMIRDTLPEKLSRRGYTTAAFTPNPFTSRYFGFDQGFDYFQDFMDSLVRRQYGRLFKRIARGNEFAFIARTLLNMWQREEVFKPWEAYYDELVEWVKSAEKPYFLWVHLMDPHVPYLAAEGYRNQSFWKMLHANYLFWREDKETTFDAHLHDRLLTAYTDSLRYADAFLERLRADLDGESIIVVHGDHGEAFGEHETYGHEPYLYEENIHVPLVVGGARSGKVTTPFSLRSLPDLILQLTTNELDLDFDIPLVTSRTWQGQKTAVRGQRVKYIDNTNGGELYDLSRGENEEIENGDLTGICESKIRQLHRTDRERAAIMDASRDV